MNYTEHYSVLNKESIDYLFQDFEEDEKLLFSDFTFGAGGHTFALLNKNNKSRVISFDQDPEALENGRNRIQNEKMSERCFLVDSMLEKFSLLDVSFHSAVLLDRTLESIQLIRRWFL